MERHNIPDKHIDRKLQALVERLTEDFTDKQVGHCIRVDYLSHEEGVLSCQKFRDLWRDAEREHDVTAFVLTSGEPDEIHIPSDRAIEIRNRKSSSLCLFVPADMKDVAVSSLGNSFSPFDISSFLKNLREHLRAEIPEPIADEVNAALRQLRGGAAVSVEQVIEFLSTVLDNPTLETVGIELWRIGLIPDLTPGLDEFVRRVDLNRLCVDKLARPSRPYSSVADRVTTLALKTGTIQADLTEYLLGKRLQSDRTWLKDLAKGSNLGSLTFERWEFPEVEPSDLETIEVAPFYINDVLRPNCGLVQEMAGTMPYAPCGPKKAVTVKWESAPKKPLDVAQWRVEMIPDTEKYEYNDMSAIELPSIIVRGSLRTAKVSLDVDISTVDVREVQIRVTALDANGSEIHSVEDNDAIEGLSQSFYLEQDSGIDSDALKRRKLPVERCLCDALVKLALTAKQPLPKPSPLDCEEKEQVYFPFLVGDRTVIRVVTTQFLRKLQASTLAIPATGGRYRAIPSGVDVLKHENVETIPLQIREQALSTAWEKFLRDRKTAFNGLSVQNKGGLIETAEITDSISKAVRNYAKSYCELLESAMELEVDKSDLTAETIHNLLGLDTLTLELKHLPGRPQATVVLPTHPLRLLWYVAYVEWVAKITKELERVPQSQRKARFSDQNLARICPYNLPAIRVTEKVTGGAIFAENLNLFYAVLLPVGAK
ncbi:MAG: hypothetical protein NT023_03365, partial [Armatimonadetes bacterium]|nr:hypothetical protein [Armatimonadota bacterium]